MWTPTASTSQRCAIRLVATRCAASALVDKPPVSLASREDSVTSRQKCPTITQLARAYEIDLASAWAYWQTKFPTKVPYAYILYGVEGYARLSPHVLTEEDLTSIATKYANQKRIYESVEEARKGLRYSIADSPAFDVLKEHIPNVDALAEPYIRLVDDVDGYRLLANAAIRALRKLDSQGLFGSGEERTRLLVAIIVEDIEEDWSLLSARKLNPRSVFKRFQGETKIEGEYKSCDAFCIAPDGNSLFATGTGKRHNKGDENNHSSEVVAYELRTGRLSRRWRYEFPRFGDSGRAIACMPVGEEIVLLRARYEEGKCKTVLMRFNRDRNEPIDEASVAGEPANFAQSPDGSTNAVILHKRRVLLFDGSFRVTAERHFDAQPRDAYFMRTGDLLLATDGGVLLVDHTLQLSGGLSC